MRFVSLFSGSSGNSLYVSHKETALLVDAGLSGKRIEKAMAEIDADPASLSGILVTHEHSDHIHGVGVLSRRYDLPIYANEATWEAMSPFIGKINDHNRRFLESKRPFSVGNLEIEAFSVSHDAASPVGYVIRDGHCSMAVATDTGVITPEIEKCLLGNKLVVLESNHDLGMLETGPYSYPLKRRIKSDVGHLSNAVAGKVACRLAQNGVEHLLLAHLSAENNYPLLAYQETEQALIAGGIRPEKDVTLAVARRECISRTYFLDE